MCLGIPMEVIETGEHRALCRGPAGEVLIDLALVGPQPVGTWLLTFLEAAREVIDADRAEAINQALAALVAAQSGEADLDLFFADLVDREPQLPDFLRKDVA